MRRAWLVPLVVLVVTGCRSSATFSAVPTTEPPERPAEFCAAFLDLLANRKEVRSTGTKAEWDAAVGVAEAFAASAPFETGERATEFVALLEARRDLAAGYDYTPVDELPRDERRAMARATRALMGRSQAILLWAQTTCRDDR